MNKAINIKDFRKALGQFPTGVTVITTLDSGGEPVGVTASSFNTVSVEPPLILWSVDKGAYSAKIFEQAEHFAVNVLGKDQVDISNKFAGRGEDKFAGVTYLAEKGGSPLLENCAAQFECKTWNVVDGGDHLIIIGEVVDYRHDEAAQPLVFSQGRYATTANHPEMMKSKSISFQEEEFLSSYLPYLLRKSYQLYSQKLYPFLQDKHSVSPEQWRVMIVLSEKKQMALEDIANLVMQPIESLADIIKGLVIADILDDSSPGFLRLTTKGQEKGQELKNTMQDFEQHLFRKFSNNNSKELRVLLQDLLCNLSD